jgi:DNA-binding transcriptional regulator YiaG
MTRAEFDAERRALGLTGVAFASLTGTHVTTVSRWGRGIPDIPGWVAPLLAAWRRGGLPGVEDAA